MNWKLTVLISCLVIFGIFENLFPFFTYKQRWSRRVATNFCIGAVNSVVTNIALASLLGWVGHQKIWLGLLHGIQSPWLAGILSFLLLDVYRYFWHVLMHKLPLGWRFHRVHHTELALNTSSAYRFHPIEVVFSYLPMVFLIWLFGISPTYAIAYELAFVAVEVFQHSNWALPLKVDRVLTYFIVTPGYHRVHHSQIVKETDSNFGSLLTIWDRIFGTFCYIRNPKRIKIGLIEEPRQLSMVDLLTLPF